jgi:hypothetical protein
MRGKSELIERFAAIVKTLKSADQATCIEILRDAAQAYASLADADERMRLKLPALVNAVVSDAAKRKGSKGGAVAAAVSREVREYAVRLAKEREPEGSWQSAPVARDAIMADVRAFARPRGRNFSERKVEEWLREAGIKRG